MRAVTELLPVMGALSLSKRPSLASPPHLFPVCPPRRRGPLRNAILVLHHKRLLESAAAAFVAAATAAGGAHWHPSGFPGTPSSPAPSRGREIGSGAGAAAGGGAVAAPSKGTAKKASKTASATASAKVRGGRTVPLGGVMSLYVFRGRKQKGVLVSRIRVGSKEVGSENSLFIQVLKTQLRVLVSVLAERCGCRCVLNVCKLCNPDAGLAWDSFFSMEDAVVRKSAGPDWLPTKRCSCARAVGAFLQAGRRRGQCCLAVASNGIF